MAKTVYVNQASGNDALDGLSEGNAVQTWTAAWALMTHGSADHLVFVGNYTVGTSESFTINKSGADTNGRMTIRGKIVAGVRPTIAGSTSSNPIFRLHSDPHNSDYTCVKDLIITGDNAGRGNAISIYTTGGGMLFRNLRIHNMGANAINISGGGPLNNLNLGVAFERVMISDSFRSSGGAHVQGVYIEYADTVSFSECAIDHCGRLKADDSGTIFNHNVYMHSSVTNITFDNCVSARASATGLQHRCNFHTCTNNLVLECPLGITFGHDDYAAYFPTRHVSGVCSGNAVLGSDDIAAGTPRHGPGIGFGLSQDLALDDNIIAHDPSAGYAALRTDRTQLDTTVTATNVYNWDADAFEADSSGTPLGSGVTVETPTTDFVYTLSDYLTAMGETPGVDPVDDFMVLALANHDDNWDDRWTSQAVNDYLRGTPDNVAQRVAVRDTLFRDRRPHIITIPFGGNYGDNVQGLDPAYIISPASRIALIRTDAKRCGAPFLWWHMPAGSLASPDNYPTSTDECLPAGVLSYISGTFKPQVRVGQAGEHERWYVYQGHLMPANGLQTSQVTSPDDRFGTTAADAAFAADAIDLFGRRGFRGNGVDASSSDPDYTELVRVATAWSEEGWSEAIPVTGSPLMPDPARITIGPFWAFDSYITTYDPTNQWTFNPQNTKVVYFLDVAIRATTSYVEDIISRGVIPGVVSGVTPDATMDYIRTRYLPTLAHPGSMPAF